MVAGGGRPQGGLEGCREEAHNEQRGQVGQDRASVSAQVEAWRTAGERDARRASPGRWDQVVEWP
jgi:hypothetical protein